MDIVACAVTSLLGKLAWARLKDLVSNASLASVTPSTVFLGLFSFQYAVVKIYRIFVYPYFLTPLRRLPGPKVWSRLRPHILPKSCPLRLPRLQAQETKGTDNPQDHHFLLGQSLRQFISGSPIEPYASWVRKWPDADLIRYHSFLNGDAVLVVSPEAHRQILQTNCYAFTKPAWYRRLIFPIVGRGLVFLDGEEHRLHRKVLSGMSCGVQSYLLLLFAGF